RSRGGASLAPLVARGGLALDVRLLLALQLLDALLQFADLLAQRLGGALDPVLHLSGLWHVAHHAPPFVSLSSSSFARRMHAPCERSCLTETPMPVSSSMT